MEKIIVFLKHFDASDILTHLSISQTLSCVAYGSFSYSLSLHDYAYDASIFMFHIIPCIATHKYSDNRHVGLIVIMLVLTLIEYSL